MRADGARRDPSARWHLTRIEAHRRRGKTRPRRTGLRSAPDDGALRVDRPRAPSSRREGAVAEAPGEIVSRVPEPGEPCRAPLAPPFGEAGPDHVPERPETDPRPALLLHEQPRGSADEPAALLVMRLALDDRMSVIMARDGIGPGDPEPVRAQPHAEVGILEVEEEVVVEPSGKLTAQQIVLFTVMLLPISVTPFFIGLTGWIYLAGATLLGIWFLFESIQTARSKTNEKARRLLLVSVLYLPVIFALMVFDH